MKILELLEWISIFSQLFIYSIVGGVGVVTLFLSEVQTLIKYIKYILYSNVPYKYLWYIRREEVVWFVDVDWIVDNNLI